MHFNEAGAFAPEIFLIDAPGQGPLPYFNEAGAFAPEI